MKKIISLLMLIALLGSTPSLQAQTRKKKTVSKQKTTAKAKSTAKPKNMLALLQGRWASLDDEKTFFEVVGDKQINYYGKDVLDTAVISFYPEYPVKITDADPKLTSGEYMVTSQRKNDYLIYSVEALTSSKLILLYLPRGHKLRYKKVQ